MMTRKEYNHALSAAAREAGVYSALMAVWCAEIISGYRTANVSPTKALDYILDGVAYVAPVVTIQPKEVPVSEIVDTAAKARDYTLVERLTKWAHFASTRTTETPADAFPCGMAYVKVYVSGRSATARALKDAGFTREGTGCYSRAFFSDGQSADAAFERAAFYAKRVEAAFLIHKVEDAQVYAGTWIN